MYLSSCKIRYALTLSTTLAFLGLAANSARAGIIFTYEAPGVQTSQAQQIVTEDFDIPPGETPLPPSNFTNFNSSIGTYDRGQIFSPDQFGGSNAIPSPPTPSNYLSVTGANVTTLTANNPLAYFGLWWSAGDPNNILTFKLSGNTIATYTTASLFSQFSCPTSPYCSNPVPPEDRNRNEPYAYINFYANNGTRFDQVVLSNTAGSNFESDNHSISTLEQPPTGEVVGTPEPGSVLGLLAVGALSSAALKRKLDKNGVVQK